MFALTVDAPVSPTGFVDAVRTEGMLGLRYYVCEACETVSSGPEALVRCARCDGESMREVTHRLGGDAYFTRWMGDDS